MHLIELTLRYQHFPKTDVYPFNLDLFRRTQTLRFDAPVTFFVGENGTGKSTLLEAIAIKCGIHIWRGMDRTRFRHNPYEKALYRFLDVRWSDGRVSGAFYASELFRNFAQILDEWASGNEELGHLVAHVLIHEIGHHFGFSDDDMEAIEGRAAE